MSRITKQKIFCFRKRVRGRDALDCFSHLAYADVRESVRTQDLSHKGHTAFMISRHSSTTEYRYLNTCDWDCMYWHCMLLLGGE